MSGANPNPATPASIGGQAPDGGQGQAPTAGQQPQAGATTPPSSSPAAPASAPATSGQSGLTPEQLAAEVARLTKELGDTRREAAEHRTARKKLEDAQLSDAQKLEQRATEAEAARDTYKARIASYAVQLAAQKLGIIDPELAALAIAGQLKYGDDGAPTNADELLKALLVNKPYLAGQAGQAQAAQQQRPPAQSGGATNPGSGARTGVFTREQISHMTAREYEQNQAAIYEAMKNGQIK